MRQPPPRRPGQAGYVRPGVGRDAKPDRRRESGGIRRETVRGDSRRTTLGQAQARPARKTLPAEILQRIDNDPLFQVMTGDQQFWIDPFTAQPVPASLGRVSAAREYLVESAVWRDKEALPRETLEFTRWRLDLVRLLPIEPRLRIFGREGRGWINPFTGDLVDDIARDEGKITMRTVNAMAQPLAACTQAQRGKPLDNQALMLRVQALGIAPGQGTQSIRHSPGSESSEMTDDLAKARTVQQNMLSDLPDLVGYEVAVHYAGHSGVSGDFYEAVRLRDGKVLLVLGDVSGHGMQAALVVATALKTLRFLSRQTSDLTTLLTQFNDEIRTDLIPGQFITCFAAVLDPDVRRMSCVRAGHHPGVIVNLEALAPVRKVGAQGTAIGLLPGAAFSRNLKPEIVELVPGDVLLQWTDGATEAINAQGEPFGDHGLYGAVLSRFAKPMQELVDGVAEEVVRYAGGALADDLTVFALAVLAPASEQPAEGETV